MNTETSRFEQQIAAGLKQAAEMESAMDALAFLCGWIDGMNRDSPTQEKRQMIDAIETILNRRLVVA